ncbi:2Fe-2S iron-sulfur cluster-binding protein [Novosphingobium sp. BL-8A]
MTLQIDKVRIHVTDLSGSDREIEGEIGNSLMEIIRGSGIDDIPAFCGGSCSCASCHVHIDPDFASLLPAMAEDEFDVLEGAAHRIEGSRLSCQVQASSEMNGMRVSIAPQE